MSNYKRPRSNKAQIVSSSLSAALAKLRTFGIGLAMLLVLMLTGFWILSGLSPLQTFAALTTAFETKPVHSFMAVERTFNGFQSMTCGEQTYDAALMTGSSSDNVFWNAIKLDMVSGRASGMVSIAVSFERSGFEVRTNHDLREVSVRVPGDAYIIYRPAVTNFTDEVHAQGIAAMFSSREPIIGQVIKEGTVALGQFAANNGGSWYEACRAEVVSAWTAIAGIYDYTAVIVVEPPTLPLKVYYGNLPYDVESVAQVIAQAVVATGE